MKKGRNSGENDDEGPQLWQHVTRSVKAYSSAKKQARTAVKGLKTAIKPRPSVAMAEKRVLKRETALKAAEPKSGKTRIDGRVDLHGLSQEKAFLLLQRFILRSAEQGCKNLLVITGKGARSEGVLRKMLPLWLENPTLIRHIASFTQAGPRDGGDGAFYVRLRIRK